jgi:copper chaperone CopZ
MATYLDTKVNGYKESKDEYNDIEDALEAIEGMNEEEVNRALGEENA